MQPTDKESPVHVLDISTTYQSPIKIMPNMPYIVYLDETQFVHTLEMQRKQL